MVKEGPRVKISPVKFLCYTVLYITIHQMPITMHTMQVTSLKENNCFHQKMSESVDCNLQMYIIISSKLKDN